MTPYCVTKGHITAEHVAMLQTIRREVEHMPDELTCHQVCERLASTFERVLARRKGTFNGGFDHSWLVFLSDPDILLDPYPWASASGPLLIDTHGMLNPWRNLYKWNGV